MLYLQGFLRMLCIRIVPLHPTGQGTPLLWQSDIEPLVHDSLSCSRRTAFWLTEGPVEEQHFDYQQSLTKELRLKFGGVMESNAITLMRQVAARLRALDQNIVVWVENELARRTGKSPDQFEADWLGLGSLV